MSVQQLSLLGTITVVYALVALSLVVLTGWTGQISLGQFAIVGVGAVAAGNLLAEARADLFLALLGAGAAGLVTSVALGLPALRVRGLFLPVTTLALAVSMSSYFLNPTYVKSGIPADGGPARPARPVRPRRRRQPVPVLRRGAGRRGGRGGEPAAAPARAGVAGRARQRVGGGGPRRLPGPHPPRRLRRQRRAGRRGRGAARDRPQRRERRDLRPVAQLRGVQHGRRRRPHLGVGGGPRRGRACATRSTS